MFINHQFGYMDPALQFLPSKCVVPEWLGAGHPQNFKILKSTYLRNTDIETLENYVPTERLQKASQKQELHHVEGSNLSFLF